MAHLRHKNVANSSSSSNGSRDGGTVHRAEQTNMPGLLPLAKDERAKISKSRQERGTLLNYTLHRQLRMKKRKTQSLCVCGGSRQPPQTSSEVRSIGAASSASATTAVAAHHQRCSPSSSVPPINHLPNRQERQRMKERKRKKNEERRKKNERERETVKAADKSKWDACRQVLFALNEETTSEEEHWRPVAQW